jgi:hypothetical protein
MTPGIFWISSRMRLGMMMTWQTLSMSIARRLGVMLLRFTALCFLDALGEAKVVLVEG